MVKLSRISKLFSCIAVGGRFRLVHRPIENCEFSGVIESEDFDGVVFLIE